MEDKSPKIPPTTIKKILKDATGLRVSADAAKYLSDKLNDFLLDVAFSAKELVEHVNKKTITKKDIDYLMKDFPL